MLTAREGYTVQRMLTELDELGVELLWNIYGTGRVGVRVDPKHKAWSKFNFVEDNCLYTAGTLDEIYAWVRGFRDCLAFSATTCKCKGSGNE